MTQGKPKVRIAINVMRARLTVVAFNLAIVTVQLGVLPRLPHAIELPDSKLSLHLGTDVTLLIGLALTVISLVCFIGSSVFDEQGTCDNPLLLVGDLFMYLGLAQSVSGFFVPFVGILGHETLPPAAQAAELGVIRGALVLVGGAAWAMACYVGPVVSLLRSPFSRRATLVSAGIYVVLLLGVANINASAESLYQARAGNAAAGVKATTFGEMLQPLRW